MTIKWCVKTNLCHLGLPAQETSDSMCGLKTAGVKLQPLWTWLSTVELHSQCLKLGPDRYHNCVLSSVQPTQCSCSSLPPPWALSCQDCFWQSKTILAQTKQKSGSRSSITSCTLLGTSNWQCRALRKQDKWDPSQLSASPNRLQWPRMQDKLFSKICGQSMWATGRVEQHKVRDIGREFLRAS